MEVKLSAVCNSHGTHRLGSINSSSLPRTKVRGCFPMQSCFAQYLILCLCFITVNAINMQLLLKKRSAAFPRRQPSSGFGEICYVHPERAHICRCINFTTIPRRIQDKCITFILLFYFLQRNPCNCCMPHYEHFFHIYWCYAGYTHLRRSTQHASVRAESVEKNFSTHPTVFLGILSFFVESLYDF